MTTSKGWIGFTLIFMATIGIGCRVAHSSSKADLTPAKQAAARAASAPADVHDCTATGPMITGVLAHVPGGNTVGGDVRETRERADGYFHVDTARTIARLQELHANNFNYLIWNSPSDYDDLRNEFLPAAQKAGLNVWVYLVPPAETSKKASYPFKTDYLKWAKALAELSVRYPVLQAWAMDDFTFNGRYFPPQYVERLQETAHAINPKLRFFAVLLPTAVTEQWMNAYGPVVDGVIAPYFDAPSNDTQRTASLNAQIDAAHALLKQRGRALYFLLYVGRHLSSPLEPTPQYASEATEICVKAMQAGRLEGIVSYGTPIGDAPPTQSNNALDGIGRLSFAGPAGVTKAGQWASASQIVTVDPTMPRYWLSFWHNDGWSSANPHGVLVKEVLIDDQVIWTKDPSSDIAELWLEGGTLEGPVDVTRELKGKATARLTLRLRAVKDYKSDKIDVSFDRLSGTGMTIKNGGFESSDGWTLTDNGGNLAAAVEIYDPSRPQKVFDAVAKAFAAYRAR